MVGVSSRQTILTSYGFLISNLFSVRGLCLHRFNKCVYCILIWTVNIVVNEIILGGLKPN